MIYERGVFSRFVRRRWHRSLASEAFPCMLDEGLVFGDAWCGVLCIVPASAMKSGLGVIHDVKARRFGRSDARISREAERGPHQKLWGTCFLCSLFAATRLDKIAKHGCQGCIPVPSCHVRNFKMALSMCVFKRWQHVLVCHTRCSLAELPDHLLVRRLPECFENKEGHASALVHERERERE